MIFSSFLYFFFILVGMEIKQHSMNIQPSKHPTASAPAPGLSLTSGEDRVQPLSLWSWGRRVLGLYNVMLSTPVCVFGSRRVWPLQAGSTRSVAPADLWEMQTPMALFR